MMRNCRLRPRIGFGTGLCIVLCLILTCAALSCGTVTVVDEVHIPEGDWDTLDKEISRPEASSFAFPSVGVWFSSDFEGGRASSITLEDSGEFRVRVSPENSPVNDSAWYAFKVWGEKAEEIVVALTYEHGTHRYRPKLSSDKRTWRSVNDADYDVKSQTEAVLRIRITEDPLWVAGQELVTFHDINEWSNQLAADCMAEKSVIGLSPEGRGVLKIELGNLDGNDIVVLLGRQHPPEVTGSFALMAFVEALCSESELAQRFRARVRVLVYPLLNPDGVALGHWRHNSKGVDLNRDWKLFRQRETALVKSDLKSHTGTFRFGIDFHSTFRDKFYFVQERGGATTEEMRWLKRFGAAVPDYRPELQPIPLDTPVAMAWMWSELAMPALTYEVGDNTDRDVVERLAHEAAKRLMEFLLEESSA